MKKTLIFFQCLFCVGCASIINTDNELVSIKGLSEEGTHFFISPYEQKYRVQM